MTQLPQDLAERDVARQDANESYLTHDKEMTLTGSEHPAQSPGKTRYGQQNDVPNGAPPAGSIVDLESLPPDVRAAVLALLKATGR